MLNASPNINGCMSKEDKVKLDGIASSLSDLCRFNFVNSISECRSDRINFLLRCPDSIIHLDPLDSYPDGIILIITTNEGVAYVKHQSGGWVYEGDEMSTGYEAYIYKERPMLITKYAGMVYAYTL